MRPSLCKSTFCFHLFYEFFQLIGLCAKPRRDLEPKSFFEMVSIVKAFYTQLQDKLIFSSRNPVKAVLY